MSQCLELLQSTRLRKLTKDPQMFSNLPKMWNLYPQKMMELIMNMVMEHWQCVSLIELHEILERTFQQTMNSLPKYTTKNQHKYPCLFVNVEIRFSRNLLHGPFCAHSHGEDKICAEFQAKVSMNRVTLYKAVAPLGRLEFGDDALHPQEHTNDNQMVFTFKPHSQLGFNMTFERLYIPHRQNSFLSVSKFTFWGEHSNFSLFLNEACFEVVVSSYLNPQEEKPFTFPFGRNHRKKYFKIVTLHYFELFFFSMDKGFVDSKMVMFRSNVIAPHSTSLFVKNTLHALTLYLQVRKFQQLQVSGQRGKGTLINLFDCPDTSCENCVTMTEKTHNFSTFQGTIEIHLRKYIDIPKLFYSRSDISADQNVQQNVTKSQIHVPLQHCSTLCSIFFEDTLGQNIDVRVEILLYIGVSHYMCKYGGIFFFETYDTQDIHGKMTVQESGIICDNAAGADSLYKKRHVSSNGSLYVVVFGYKEISSVKATVTATQTKCLVIYLCKCIHRRMLSDVGEMLCPNQMHSHLVFLHRKIDSGHREYNAIRFNMKNDHCIVLTKTKVFSHREKDCFVTLQSSFEANTMVTFMVEGSMKPLFQHFQELGRKKQLLSPNKEYYDYVSVKRTAGVTLSCLANGSKVSLDSVCFKSGTCSRNKETKTLICIDRHRTNFRFIITTRKPESTIEVKFHAVGQSHSWFDATVQRNVIEKLEDVQLFNLYSHWNFPFVQLASICLCWGSEFF